NDAHATRPPSAATAIPPLGGRAGRPPSGSVRGEGGNAITSSGPAGGAPSSSSFWGGLKAADGEQAPRHQPPPPAPTPSKADDLAKRLAEIQSRASAVKATRRVEHASSPGPRPTTASVGSISSSTPIRPASQPPPGGEVISSAGEQQQQPQTSAAASLPDPRTHLTMMRSVQASISRDRSGIDGARRPLFQGDDGGGPGGADAEEGAAPRGSADAQMSSPPSDEPQDYEDSSEAAEASPGVAEDRFVIRRLPKDTAGSVGAASSMDGEDEEYVCYGDTVSEQRPAKDHGGAEEESGPADSALHACPTPIQIGGGLAATRDCGQVPSLARPLLHKAHKPRACNGRPSAGQAGCGERGLGAAAAGNAMGHGEESEAANMQQSDDSRETKAQAQSRLFSILSLFLF
ncbi:hypothetical protein THAOC_32949, partial [Thalassiosira oceanica]